MPSFLSMWRNALIFLRIPGILILTWASLAVFHPGSAEASSTTSSRSDLADRLYGIRSIGLIPPSVRIFEISAGGVREYKEDWSAKGKENLTKSLQDHFQEKLFVIKTDTLDNNVKADLDDVLALYRMVIGSYLLQFDSEQGFPVKQDFSEYVLGPLDNLFDALNVDALVIVKGVDEISTAGRKTMIAVGMLAAIALGTGGVPHPGVAGMDIGFIDRSGAVLWYKLGGLSGNDFRDPKGASKITEEILFDFPGFNQ